MSTLDSFSHNIIRSFAKELKIASDFQLILDSEQFIFEAIERLLSLVGVKKEITKALVDFANSKISEGKSWDVTYDLKKLSVLLNNENYYNKIKNLEGKTMKDFFCAQEKIFKTVKELETTNSKPGQVVRGDAKIDKYRDSFFKELLSNIFKKIKKKRF